MKKMNIMLLFLGGFLLLFCLLGVPFVLKGESSSPGGKTYDESKLLKFIIDETLEKTAETAKEEYRICPPLRPDRFRRKVKMLWGIDDKSYEGLTNELNAAFKKYEINTCIQKIAMLAQVAVETGFFKEIAELPSNYRSSKSSYKGRGILQLTGDKKDKIDRKDDGPGVYTKYQDTILSEYDVVTNPQLIEQKLHLAIDSGCWFFSKAKTCPTWNPSSYTGKEKEAVDWKINKYGSQALGKLLSILATFMHDDGETYFFLISKLLHGYPVKETDETPGFMNYEKRKLALYRIKKWFQYDKDICNHIIPKRIDERASWMAIALQELANYGGSNETTFHDRISEYHKYGGRLGKANGNTSWCASFAGWCLMEKGYANPQSVRSRAFCECSILEKCDVFYGAVAVFADCNSAGKLVATGHVGFVYAKLADGRYALLGGNQGDTIKLSPYNCTGDVFVGYTDKSNVKHYRNFLVFYKPKQYEPSYKDLNLKEYNDTDAANVVLNIFIEESANGKSTQ